VRKGVVVLGGNFAGHDPTASVEILDRDSSGAVGNIFKILPLLSCGPIVSSTAFMIDESESDQGQVLLIGGGVENHPSSAVRKVDDAQGRLAGACSAPPSLRCPQGHVITDCTAGRLPDGQHLHERFRRVTILCADSHVLSSLHEEPRAKAEKVIEHPFTPNTTSVNIPCVASRCSMMRSLHYVGAPAPGPLRLAHSTSLHQSSPAPKMRVCVSRRVREADEGHLR